jgi:hypothetical protein
MERLLASRVSDEAAAEVVDAWLGLLRQGDKDALWLIPYVFGRPPKAVEPTTGPAGQSITLALTPLGE